MRPIYNHMELFDGDIILGYFSSRSRSKLFIVRISKITGNGGIKGKILVGGSGSCYWFMPANKSINRTIFKLSEPEVMSHVIMETI